MEMPFWGDMLVPWRVSGPPQKQVPASYDGGHICGNEVVYMHIAPELRMQKASHQVLRKTSSFRFTVEV